MGSRLRSTTGLRSTSRWILVGLLALTSAVAAPTAEAVAATCSSAGGVSVVVDYRELGGATVTECVADGGGKSAAAVFAAAGVAISYATRQPGFVCRVNGVPSSDPCVNTSPSNAYWGLWWSNGTKESWTFASSGVGSLTVPAGGSVGWAWQQDRGASGVVAPSVAPPVAPAPSGTPTPSATPSSTGSPSPSSSPGATPSPGQSPSTTPSPSASPSKSPGPRQKRGSKPGPNAASPSPSASSSVSPSASASASATPSDAPLGTESPSDSSRSAKKKAGKPEAESPSDSADSEGLEGDDLTPESPSDSSDSGQQVDGADADADAADDQPARVPGWALAGIGVLLAAGIVGSAVASRRRRA